MTILLTGATGFIGNQLLQFLVQQGHSVTACCRNPSHLLINTNNIRPLAIDFTTANTVEQWLEPLKHIEVVINCVGIIAETHNQTFEALHQQAPIALFNAAVQTGVKKIIQISALGADEQATTAYHLSKKAADDVLRQLPIAWFILQPSIVYGERARSSALLQALAALPIHILPEQGSQLLQPVAIQDLVAAVACCLNKNTPSQQTIVLVGAETISYAELLQGLRQRFAKIPALTFSLPYKYLSALASLGKYLGEPILSKDNISMLSRGNTADISGISQLLQRPPLSIKQTLLRQPASQAEYWHAHLYFLKPVLALVVVFVWLWSGITSLFFYSHQQSYQLLAATGVTGIAAPFALYGLAIMDISLGLATFLKYRLQALLLWQIVIVLSYTVIVAITLPEFIFHPFGALLKNLPFLLCLVIYRQLVGVKS